MASDIARLNFLRRALHWAGAIVVIGMVPAGLVFTDFDNRDSIEGAFGAGSFDALYNFHKSVGAVALALVAARLAAALIWPAPSHAGAIPAVQSAAARAMHVGLYALLVATPILGWAGTSAYPAPLPVFGLFDLPGIVAPNRPVAEFLLALHGTCAILLIALVVLHVAAALYHRNVRKDGVFARIALW
ncbi:MAG: cytochrome b [Rubrimonas sp.]